MKSFRLPQFAALVVITLFGITAAAQDITSFTLDTGSSAFSRMGRDVAVYGDYGAVIGSNRVEIYRWSGTNWVKHQTIDFGSIIPSSVAMEGDVMAVGQSGFSGQRGRVSVYHRNQEGTWEFLKFLNSPVSRNDVYFGRSIAMDGDYMIIGADGGPPPGDNFRSSGSAYIYYRHQGGTDNWGRQSSLHPIDNPNYRDGTMNFGYSVAISGDWALVGSPKNHEAYLFRRSGTSWIREQRLDYTVTNQLDTDRFGYAVAIDGDRAAVSAIRGRTSSNISPSNEHGTVYVYQRSGNNWNNTNTFRHENSSNGDQLGSSLYFHGEFLLAGARGINSGNTSNVGAVVVFRQSGSSWQQEMVIQRGGPQNARFGDAIQVDRYGQLFIGMPEGNSGATAGGGAFAYILIPRPPASFNAADGTNDSSILLSWQSIAGEDGYRIFVNGEVRDTRGPNITSYTDVSLAPGTYNVYGVQSFNALGSSEMVTDLGYTFPTGRISGSVQTVVGSGVPGVFVEATPYATQALQLNGSGYVEIPHTSRLNQSDTFTIEGWIRLTGTVGRQVIYSTRRFNEPGSFQFETGSAGTGAGGRLAVSSINTWVVVSPPNVLQPGTWHHVAYVRDGDHHRLLVDGQPVATENSSVEFVANSSPKLVGTGANLSGYLNGSIDELKIWNVARTDEQIADNRFLRFIGNESGLAAYWRMTQVFGSDQSQFQHYVADFAGGSHGQANNYTWSSNRAPVRMGSFTNNQGEYSINRINFGQETKYLVTPSLEGHGFDPGSREVDLESGTSHAANTNFTDTTTFTVSGRIEFDGTQCPLADVDIYVNDVLLGTTRPDGTYEVSILTPGSVTIRPDFHGHTFEPATIALNVFNNFADQDFSNTQRHTLDGKVAGGDCLVNIGTGDVSVSGPGGCFTANTTTDANNSYSFDLPALPELAIDVDVADNPFVEFQSREVSLRDSSATVDFLFRSAPQISLTGLPDPVGACNVKVLKQLESYGFEVEVYEQYGNTTCPVEIGELRIFNTVADKSEPDTVAISDGLAVYSFQAGNPNIVGGGQRPYQKLLQIEVRTGDPESTYRYAEVFDYWFVVEGNRPREQTFATVSPEIPLFILRDPPGDQSYSFLNQETSVCNSVSMSVLAGAGTSVWTGVKAGTRFQAGLGVSVETEVWVDLSASLSIESTIRGEEEYETCLVTTESFETSSSEDVIGDGGDIYVGAALNILYALTDVLTFNPATCQVELSKTVMFGNDGFATRYIYTEDFIENNLIPRLADLRDNPSVSPDSAAFLADQVRVWEQTIQMNRDIKESVRDLPALANYSLNGGAGPVTYQQSVTRTSRQSIEFNLELEKEIALEIGAEVGGVGARGGASVKIRKEVGSARSLEVAETNTTGFVLNDNDPDDFFSINIKPDPVFGTPVFELVSGTSSCPWEPGTQPREGVQLTANTLVQNEVPSGQPATFRLTLGNTSQSEEARDYRLAAIPASNPDGAVMLVNGIPISTLEPYTIPAGSSFDQTLTVFRGPEAFDYEGLQVMLRSLCDSQIADTLTVTARFESTCSPVTLVQPEEGWLVNSTSDNTLLVAVRDYVKTQMSNIKLEYADAGSNNWRTARLIPADDLPANNALIEWNVESLPDGAYDFRVALQCNAGVTHTPRVRGRIDRSPPRVAGLPEPSNGILGLGDVISVTFNKPINPSTASDGNVSLVDLATGSQIPADITVTERTILIIPEMDDDKINGRLLQASVSGIADLNGNVMSEPRTWLIRVRNNPLRWNRVQVVSNALAGDIRPFSARLLNQGPDDESFTIDKVPDWLSVSSLSGNIPSGGEEFIAFTPEPTLPNGVYRDTVTAMTSRGPEPLLVQLNVQCEAPEWELNESLFAHSMLYTAVFSIGDVPFSEENDLVAAFVGDEIRGVSSVVPIVPTDGSTAGYEYAAFLTIFSNSDAGDEVEFRLWDASECRVMEIAESVPFTADASIGSAAMPERLTVSGAVLQTISLAEGSTWMSLAVEANQMEVNHVLRRVRPLEGDVIRGQTAYSQYLSGTGWVGTLNELAPGLTYKTRLGRENVLEFIGTRVNTEEKPIAVSEGWNWIGYLPEDPLPVSSALASLDIRDGDIIRSQTAFSQFSSGSWVGNLSTMQPGRGYKLHLSNSGVLEYPGTGGGLNDPRLVVGSDQLSDAPDWTVDVTDFENLMSVTGVVHVDGFPAANANYLISAWSGGELRGVAEPVFILDRWMFFLNVYGDFMTGEISFMLYDGNSGRIYDLTEKIPFAQETVAGTPRNPFVWQASTATDISDGNYELPTEFAIGQNYPNPFNPATRIRFALPEDTEVKIVVYDLLGRQVAVLADGHVRAGYHTVTFDASRVASGVYIYRMDAGSFSETRKMTLIR